MLLRAWAATEQTNRSAARCSCSQRSFVYEAAQVIGQVVRIEATTVEEAVRPIAHGLGRRRNGACFLLRAFDLGIDRRYGSCGPGQRETIQIRSIRRAHLGHVTFVEGYLVPTHHLRIEP